MLMDEVLKSIKLPQKETLFISPPKKTYLVYHIEKQRRGADEQNLVSEYDITLEVYSALIDQGAEEQIGSVLDSFSVEHTKAERSWIASQGLFMTAFYFTLTEKE